MIWEMRQIRSWFSNILVILLTELTGSTFFYQKKKRKERRQYFLSYSDGRTQTGSWLFLLYDQNHPAVCRLFNYPRKRDAIITTSVLVMHLLIGNFVLVSGSWRVCITSVQWKEVWSEITQFMKWIAIPNKRPFLSI